jgi:tRNA dimethylallyltransferase
VQPPLLVIGGPTATGKTAIAIEIALALTDAGRAAEVITADSRQVYRGMDVGTAKPTLAERRGVIHHGLDLVEPDVDFSVSDFAAHCGPVLASLAARGGGAILAGGTGFWLRAIARGLALDDLPHDPALRASLEAALAAEGPEPLVARLCAAAPGLAATVDLHNPRRVVRALEIATLRGDEPLPAPRGYDGPVVWLLLDVADRPRHRVIIAARSEQQLDGGILPEAAALRERFGEGPRAFSSIGYREAWDLLDGRITRADYLRINTQRNVDFARRQRTWFRRERADLVFDPQATSALEIAGATVAAVAALGG